MRSEQSQQRRKEGLAQKIASEEAVPSTAWKDALPHLDEALNKLPESDRRVLILHFFEEKSFPKVAQALGKTPAAAQKQSRRALEKLAQILKRKGVVISSIALGSCLSSELAKAAPPSVVKALSSITLSTQPPLLGTLVLSKAPLILAIAAGASLVTLIGARQMEISRKKEHNKQLRAQLAQAPLKSARPLRSASDSGGGRFQPDAALLAKAYYDADQTETVPKFLRSKITCNHWIKKPSPNFLPNPRPLSSRANIRRDLSKASFPAFQLRIPAEPSRFFSTLMTVTPARTFAVKG